MSRQKIACTGVLLAGGESRRMGRNKAFLEIEGRPLIIRNLEVMDCLFSEVIISSRDAALYSGLGYKVILDTVQGKGPLGGLYTVLQQANFDDVFLAACDMPFLNEMAIRAVYRKYENCDVVLPDVKGKAHTLHGFYNKRILPLVEEKIKNNQLSVFEMIKECNTKIVTLENEISDSIDFLSVEQSLVNVNTPDEWEALQEKNIMPGGNSNEKN